MARRLDTILVVDVESTCWKGSPPPGQTSDIIEVGVVSLDLRSLEVGPARSLTVRPARSEVGSFCTELTTIRPEDVAGAPDLAEACAVLRREFDSKERPWASYGDYDRKQFERCCADQGIGYPFGPAHLNVKTLLAMTLGLGHEVGMAQALEKLRLPLEGTHHRGGDDARNIGRILATLLGAGRFGLTIPTNPPYPAGPSSK